MTSKNKETTSIDIKMPKTPHEEVMFVVESTNDIVSEILEILKRQGKLRQQKRVFGK